jgi:hypothetical protein
MWRHSIVSRPSTDGVAWGLTRTPERSVRLLLHHPARIRERRKWVGWLGLPIGEALLLGSLEFVGPNEKAGWSVAGTVVPIAYVAWSLWLVAIGIGLML